MSTWIFVLFLWRYFTIIQSYSTESPLNASYIITSALDCSCITGLQVTSLNCETDAKYITALERYLSDAKYDCLSQCTLSGTNDFECIQAWSALRQYHEYCPILSTPINEEFYHTYQSSCEQCYYDMRQNVTGAPLCNNSFVSCDHDAFYYILTAFETCVSATECTDECQKLWLTTATYYRNCESTDEFESLYRNAAAETSCDYVCNNEENDAMPNCSDVREVIRLTLDAYGPIDLDSIAERYSGDNNGKWIGIVSIIVIAAVVFICLGLTLYWFVYHKNAPRQHEIVEESIEEEAIDDTL